MVESHEKSSSAKKVGIVLILSVLLISVILNFVGFQFIQPTTLEPPPLDPPFFQETTSVPPIPGFPLAAVVVGLLFAIITGFVMKRRKI